MDEHLNDFLIAGYFNAILCPVEKTGENSYWSRHKAFANFISNIGVVDMPFKVHPSTWTNRRPWQANIQECLDRALASPSWSNLFPQAFVLHLAEYWLKSLSYSNTIHWSINTKIFSSLISDGNIILKLLILLTWSKGIHKNQKKEIEDIEANFSFLNQTTGGKDVVTIQDMEKSLARAIANEEAFWAQKARMDCLNSGMVIEGMPPWIDANMNNSLIQQVTNEEIRGVVFSIYPDKNLRHDGFTGRSFHKHWDLIQQEVCN
ncbi:conserved hypothetical protein [Ricinus communis]|uniref:Uncharacterized protein n=1 Tax=Ricinus communis TaxID=3988 RepID=B9RRF6_RICCO|nr:conserved hypothetical protein [Ricinus communis]